MVRSTFPLPCISDVYYCHHHHSRRVRSRDSIRSTSSSWRRFRPRAFRAITFIRRLDKITGTLRVTETYDTSRQRGSGGGGEAGRRRRGIHGRKAEGSYKRRSTRVLCHGHHPNPSTTQKRRQDYMEGDQMAPQTICPETLRNGLNPALNHPHRRCHPLQR